jgi:hypothetical protein
VQTVRLFLLLPAVWLAFFAHAGAATEVPCRIASGLVFVEVRAPGRACALQFLLDTGAGESVIDARCAAGLGLKAGRSRAVLGVHSTTIARQFSGFGGRVGGLPLPGALLGLDLSAVSAACGQPIDGILGLDFLRQHLVQIEYASARVRFYRRGEMRPAGEAFPLVRRNDALCVRVEVDGAPRLLRLDTGCDSPLQIVASSGLGTNGEGASVAAGARAPRHGRATLALGSLRFPNIEAGIHPRPLFPGEDGLLGNGVLSRFTLTIDAAGRRLFLARH